MGARESAACPILWDGLAHPTPLLMEPRADPNRPVPPAAEPTPSYFSDGSDSVDEENAEVGTRLLAKFIDGVVASLVWWVLYTLGLGAFLSGLAAAAYLLVSDGLDFGAISSRSVGKHVTNLDVCRLDGEPMDLETSARRNWMFTLGFLAVPGLSRLASLIGLGLIAYEVYRMATSESGRRWGDELAETRVVKV